MTQPTLKSVVLCADDYALNTPVSQGIVALALLGRLSATSVMVHSPTWAQDAVALCDVRDRLDVGLHLDWTSLTCNNTGDQAHSVDKIEISRTLSTDLLKKSRQQVRTIAGMAPCPGFSP